MINVHFIVYYLVLADLETGTPGRIGALLQVLTGDNPLKKKKKSPFRQKKVTYLKAFEDLKHSLPPFALPSWPYNSWQKT